MLCRFAATERFFETMVPYLFFFKSFRDSPPDVCLALPRKTSALFPRGFILFIRVTHWYTVQHATAEQTGWQLQNGDIRKKGVAGCVISALAARYCARHDNLILNSLFRKEAF